MQVRFHPWLSSRLALTVALCGAVALGVSAPGLAQQAPTQVNPGTILPSETDQTRFQQMDRQKQLQQDADKVEIDIPEPAKAESGGESPRFQVTRIDLQGNTIFTTEELRPIVAKYEGREVTLDDLGKAVDELNQKYRSKGYLTSQAYVPPQDIEGGVVKIQIVEGSVGNIDISGNKYYRTWAIDRAIGYKEGEVLNIKELEDNLNRLNQQNGFRLKAVLKAGEETGETDITFQVAERQPWQISPTFDNQGRPFVGMYRWGAQIQNQNLSGIGDRMLLKWLMALDSGTGQTQVGVASYNVPLNRYGTELGYGYSFSYVDVDLDNTSNKIEGFAHSHSLTLSQPLDKNRTFVADASFNARRVRSLLQGQETNQDDIRSLSFGLNFNKTDRWGRTFVRAQTDVAPKWWLGSDTAFWKASLYGNRLQRLPFNSLLILRGSAQFTPDALPPIEQFQIGGANSVRGYTEGLLIGDRGYNVGAELQFPIPGLQYLSPWLNSRVQGAYFIDLGQVWTDTSSTSYISPSPTRNYGSSGSARTLLVGTGLGVRARLTRFLIGFVDFGWGLTAQGNIEPMAQPTVRVHFGVRSDLLPDTIKMRETQQTPRTSQLPDEKVVADAKSKRFERETDTSFLQEQTVQEQPVEVQPDNSASGEAFQSGATSSVNPAQDVSAQSAQMAEPVAAIAKAADSSTTQLSEQEQRQQLGALLQALSSSSEQ